MKFILKKELLPLNWDLQELQNICSQIADIDHKMPKAKQEGIPFISAKDITDNGKIVFENCKKISEEDFTRLSRKIRPQKGDIIYSRIGTIGRAAIVNVDIPFQVSYSCCTIKPLSARVNTNFLKYFLTSQSALRQALDGVVGIGVPDLGMKQIKEFKIPLPPLAEQERIVAKIEELFSELDAGLESLKTAQAQLKTYRQAVLKWAFEGKLTNENLNEGKLPDGWKWLKIGDICKTIDGDRGKNYPKKNEFSDEGYCLFLSTKNVRDGRFVFDENIFITKEKDDALRGGKLEINDVVITTRGTLGNVALYSDKVPFKHVRINSGMLILRITDSKLSNFYLMKFITSPVFTSQLKAKQTGTAQPQIPANILREIEIPFGSLEEQQPIIEEIESRLSVCDKLEETINQSLAQAESLRQSILKQAFEGKLVAQDESEETTFSAQPNKQMTLFV